MGKVARGRLAGPGLRGSAQRFPGAVRASLCSGSTWVVSPPTSKRGQAASCMKGLGGRGRWQRSGVSNMLHGGEDGRRQRFSSRS